MFSSIRDSEKVQLCYEGRIDLDCDDVLKKMLLIPFLGLHRYLKSFPEYESFVEEVVLEWDTWIYAWLVELCLCVRYKYIYNYVNVYPKCLS